MQKLILILLFGTIFSAPIIVNKIEYETDYKDVNIKPQKVSYFKLKHDGSEDTIYIQFRFAKNNVKNMKVEFTVFDKNPTEKDIMQDTDWVEGFLKVYKMSDYDYSRFTIKVTEIDYIVIRVKYDFSASDIVYNVRSQNVYMDLDSLTRVVYANAADASHTTKVAMAYIVINRAEKRENSVYLEATLGYQCFKYYFGTMFSDAEKECRKVAVDAYRKKVADPTKGATYFYKGYNMPSWAMGKTPIIEIEGIRYFKNIYPYN